MLHVHITLQSREFSIQNPILQKTKSSSSTTTTLQQIPEILRIEGKEIFWKCIRVSYKTFKATPVAPEIFRTFQSFMIFQPFQAILQYSSISRESTPFQHSPTRKHVLQFDWFPENSTEYQLGNYRHYKHYIQRKGDVAISVKMSR